ncbi:hypothetical protein CEUSTIGMA_g2677.t1 [Chlamydomonas eustigma]|uniref:Tyrosine specific protein phosphatases domain-containing protein n=1 Tax=Chlamydomonas eustigma TaxID=1157962 RepID=A0A250WX85_9CHLO|nr:hypothetical protein CEUSTIGMA_g2677.t1 [Chlamydomonas eustigma]|eukprot:GAX75232.1 hypothetical protein CEUSTIGMA_g2677.t1 [Chlamydomonas eustigma]
MRTQVNSGGNMIRAIETNLRCSPFKSTYQSKRLSSVRASNIQSRAVPRLQPLDDSYEEWHTFKPYANWLVPGHVMLGRYPFVEPSRCLSRKQGEEQLSQILNVGITTFVCLQDELPPQDMLKISGKDGFLPYKTTAELIQAALNGPAPETEDLHALRTPALNKFLPPKKKQASLVTNRKELKFLHSPIVDLGLPSVEALQKLLFDLETRLESGEKLYIHCWGGRGRAGTVGACMLQRMYGVSVDESLERVQRAFSTRGDVQYKSPETDEQFEFVRNYARLVASS